jgi:hypothetical protein
MSSHTIVRRQTSVFVTQCVTIWEEDMDEPRKLREDLTEAEIERLKRSGALTFKSIRAPNMRVEPFIPNRTQH